MARIPDSQAQRVIANARERDTDQRLNAPHRPL
jgi:hypothetical protein